MTRARGGRPAGSGLIEAGQVALASGEWEAAREHFAAAVAEAETPDALDGLGMAAWWLNDAETLFDTRERAYNLYRAASRVLDTARLATWIATDYVDFRGEVAVAQGWLRRARRLLEGHEDTSDYGWLCIHEAEKHLLAHDTDPALELGTAAAAIGRRLGEVDLEMMALATQGLALVTEGELAEGMSLLDEAAAAAFGGEFAHQWGVVWCSCYMLYACERARDYSRAADWCQRIEDWSDRAGVPLINRSCRAYYAGVLIWHGTWDRAEELLTEAAERLAEIRPPMAAEPTVRLGELRRRQGRLDDAWRIFEESGAHPLALLGFGEVCLDRDEPAGARDRAEQYLREVGPEHHTPRAAGLELLVRAAAALGDLDAAGRAVAELEVIAARVETAPMRGSAGFAAGAYALAAGDADGARTAFEDTVRHYQRSEAPYEAARARVELARALAALERREDARREAEGAAVALREMGAAHEATRAEALARSLGVGRERPASPLTAREREVLRLVAEGKSDRLIAQDLVVSEHTVHRHVANILTKLDCPNRSAAVAEALRRGLL